MKTTSALAEAGADRVYTSGDLPMTAAAVIPSSVYVSEIAQPCFSQNARPSAACRYW